MNGPKRLPEQTARLAFVIGILIHLLFLISLRNHGLDPLFVEARDSYGQASDFFGIYQAGDNLLHGVSIYDSYDYGNQAERRVPYFYFYRYLPPTAYLAAVDAAILSPWVAYIGWVVLNEVLILILLVSWLRLDMVPSWKRWALGAITLGFTPFYLEQWMGQFSFLMAILLWFTFLPEIRGRRPGGSWRRPDLWAWTGAIALKTFPALFALVYLRQGRYRRVWIAAAVVILLCLPYFVFRIEDLVHFAHLNLRPLPPEFEKSRFGMVALIHTLGVRILGDLAKQPVNLGIRHVPLSNLPIYGWMALIFSFSGLITWRYRVRSPAPYLALWTLTFFLVFKDIWEYHHVMLLPVIYLLSSRGSSRWPLLLGAILAAPTPYLLYADTLGTAPVSTWPTIVVLAHYGSMALPVLALYVLSVQECLVSQRLRR